MKQYHDLCKHILNHGVIKDDRTNTGTISIFGYQMRFDLTEGFPLLTTKKVHFKSILHELLWFISGETNIKYLVDNDVKIWTDWPYQIYTKSADYANETIEEFAIKIKGSQEFASKHANLGPVYGKQWRDFNGVDQLNQLIEQIKTTPNSRRLILTAWNPAEVNQMALPPCHAFMQFYVVNNKLSLQLYQRSADCFLGVPFNIASYATFLMMIAQVTDLEVGEFIHTLGDAHIYLNHLEQVKLQLSRIPRKLPTLKLNPAIKKIEDFKFEDFTLENYKPHPGIKGVVAV